MTILNWLNKPYPLLTSTKAKVLISLLFGIFIYLFLSIFQPFDIDKIVGDKTLFLLGFSGVTLGVMLFNFILLPLLFPKLFDAGTWNIKKEILFITWIILGIAILNHSYNSIIGASIVTQFGLIRFIIITLSVGIFPTTLYVLINELMLSKKGQKVAEEINEAILIQSIETTNNSENLLLIVSESNKDKFQIYSNDLVYIKSEDNYCKVVYIKNEILASKLLRVSLKKIETQLENFNVFVRCHRSYIVNKKHILKVSGNARSCNIHFQICDESVPVSRSFPKEKLMSS